MLIFKVIVNAFDGDFMNFDGDWTNNYLFPDSHTIGVTFFTNVDSTVQTLATYMENSDISGKIFDMTNGGEFENNVLYVDNVNTGDSLQHVIQMFVPHQWHLIITLSVAIFSK